MFSYWWVKVRKFLILFFGIFGLNLWYHCLFLRITWVSRQLFDISEIFIDFNKLIYRFIFRSELTFEFANFRFKKIDLFIFDHDLFIRLEWILSKNN